MSNHQTKLEATDEEWELATKKLTITAISNGGAIRFSQTGVFRSENAAINSARELKRAANLADS